jgi:hypothetical protein
MVVAAVTKVEPQQSGLIGCLKRLLEADRGYGEGSGRDADSSNTEPDAEQTKKL